MGDMAATAIIDEILDAFLTDQRERLSARTMHNYETVVDLLRDSLNGYGPNTLEYAEHQRWEQAFHAGDIEAFCHLFGPEHILGRTVPTSRGKSLRGRTARGVRDGRAEGTRSGARCASAGPSGKERVEARPQDPRHEDGSLPDAQRVCQLPPAPPLAPESSGAVAEWSVRADSRPASLSRRPPASPG
jgi:hypothetical protein